MKHPVLVPARADEVADGEDVLLIGSDGRVTTIRRQASGDGPDRVLVRIAGQAAADAWARPGLYFRHSEALPIDMNLAPDRILYRVRAASPTNEHLTLIDGNEYRFQIIGDAVLASRRRFMGLSTPHDEPWLAVDDPHILARLMALAEEGDAAVREQRASMRGET